MTRHDHKAWLAVALAALALAFFDWDNAVLSLLPGWSGVKDHLRAIEPLLVNAVHVLIDVLLAVALVHLLLRSGGDVEKRPRARDWLGLTASPMPAIRVISLALIPEYLVFALTRPINHEVASLAVAYLAFIGPFAEEVIYRGVSFGLLRRIAGWPFWLAAGLPAVAFGLGHANPFSSSPSLDEIMTFAITFAGAMLFSWLYERWKFNLWVPILLHMFMNFAWSLFRVGEGAFAGWLPLAMQVTTVTIAVLLTLRWTSKEQPTTAAA